ncbi:MAG: hypothetical protein A3K10_14950 [Bacteroidetes bacterium RIFCSPLOWO2_12_FULL_31_6]|nr:MAG: hypothetical protein A3K10_14950 [Bacteroidetes bacterium RIFCSPLOWO2_12_FULL_31_6]
MSNSNDNLFLLIKSLTQSEKRYFKLHNGKQDGRNKYIDIFDAIDNCKAYNEEELKNGFKNKELVKNFAVIKNYLFNTIVESLHEHSAYDTAEYKLEALIKKIKVLYEKALIDLCLKYIEKAKKLANEHECFTELIQLLSIQHQISLRNTSTLFNKQKEIREELDLSVEKSINYSLYLKLIRNITYYTQVENLNIESNEISSLIKHPLLSERNLTLSKKALSLYLKIHATISEYNGEKLDAIQYNYEILKSIELSPTIFNENPFSYARAINAYLQDAINVKHFEHFEHYLSELKKLLSKKISSHHLHTIKGFYYLNIINLQIVYGRFNEVIEIIEKERDEIFKNLLIPTKFRIGIIYFECIAYIGTQQYKTTLKILHTNLSSNENTIFPLKRISRILSLIMQYELGNYTGLMSEIESASKFINSLENNMGEKLIIKHIKQLLNCFDKKDKIDCLEKFKNELIKLESNSKEFLTISYFDFLSWVESKLRHKAFKEVINEKALSYYPLKQMTNTA